MKKSRADKAPEKSGMLEFTVDLPNICRELASTFSQDPAAWGAVEGIRIAVGHMMEIGKVAIIENNIPILLRLFATGIIENPRPVLMKNGTWNEKFNDLADRVGAGEE